MIQHYKLCAYWIVRNNRGLEGLNIDARHICLVVDLLRHLLLLGISVRVVGGGLLYIFIKLLQTAALIAFLIDNYHFVGVVLKVLSRVVRQEIR